MHSGDSGRGGGNIAMYRLHLGLKKAGVDSRILCNDKKLVSLDSVAIPQSYCLAKLESLLRQVTSRFGLNDIHCLNTFKIKELGVYLDADILHFHCIHGGFFNYLALPFLTANKTAVFTLHDTWPFTGHCAVSYDCDRWKVSCGKCPYLDAPPAIRRDNTRLEWKLKNWVYQHSRLSIVTPSTWITEQARQSMVKHFPIYHIPHGVDTDAFQPLDPEPCRSLLAIPPGKRVLMFASMQMDDHNKGGDLLVRALQRLPGSLKTETMLLLLGDGGEVIAETAGIHTLNLGYVSDDRLKAIAYSAADLFVSPTRAESFGLVFLESMACGTPMVSFRVGGVSDPVRPGVTGYLAEPGNAKDLCDGIVQLLEDEPLRRYMSQQCRAIALKEYSLELYIQRHLELYRQLLQN